MGPLADLGAKILVLNAGSSSLKFKLFNVQPFLAGVGGLVERIGDTANSTLVAKNSVNGQTKKWNEQVPIPDHVSAMKHIMEFLDAHISKDICTEVKAVGHRIVHGLNIHKAVLLTDEVVATIREAATLAPLHNPPGLSGIQAAQQVFKGVPQVGVFDTAFHQTMPPAAFMYGLPYEHYTKYAIRRYGFHGTSHQYLVGQAAQMLGKAPEAVNVITCHLGNGSSITAVRNGLSIDTSMGMTPLEGLMMGTRAGDMDPAVPLFLQQRLGADPRSMDTLLNKKSGLLGVCGDNDLRSVIARRAAGDERAALAFDMFVYRVRKYLGAYSAALGGAVDAVVFSAGIGENSALVRGAVCADLEAMGISIDAAKNEAAVGGAAGDISAPGAATKVLVVPTDEELCIAQQTLGVVEAAAAAGPGGQQQGQGSCGCLTGTQHWSAAGGGLAGAAGVAAGAAAAEDHCSTVYLEGHVY